MSDTNLIVAQIKRMMSEVLELRDQKPENQSRAIELLKAVANALILGRKNAAKTATGVHFDSDTTEHLWNLKPDLEVGGPEDEGGWYGLYLGELAEGFDTSTGKDKANLQRNHGAILHELGGEVTGQLFPREEDAVDEWEEAISPSEPELSHP